MAKEPQWRRILGPVDPCLLWGGPVRLSFVVALLVTVASFAPFAGAACGPNPSGPATAQAIIDAGSGLVVYGGPLVVATYDVTLTNVSMSTLATARLFLPPPFQNASEGSPRGPVFDNAHYGRQNFTFPKAFLNATGNWSIRTTNATLATFQVFPGTTITQGPTCPPGGAMPVLSVSLSSRRPLVEYAQDHVTSVRVDNSGNATALNVMVTVSLTVNSLSSGPRILAVSHLATVPAGSFRSFDVAWNARGIVGDVEILARTHTADLFDRFGATTDFVLVSGQGGYILQGQGGLLP